jgi:hypothetical protein
MCAKRGNDVIDEILNSQNISIEDVDESFMENFPMINFNASQFSGEQYKIW